VEKFHQRGRIIIYALGLVTLVLLLTAARLQLVDNSYRIKAESTTIGESVQYPARGLFKDRNGELLVLNEPIYDIIVTANQVDPSMDTMRFCQLLNISKELFIQRMDKDFNSVRYSRRLPFIFLSKIAADQVAPLIELLYEFPGFDYVVRSRRNYKHPYASHILGYISEVNPAQIESSAGGYEPGDYIGASGLESSFEVDLRGTKGVEYVLRDNLGRKVESLRSGELDTSALSGRDIVISIDMKLQAYAEELMKNKRGAIVAIEPATGEILASVSSPSYDPNSLSVGYKRGEAYEQLSNDSLKPLLNRAVMSKYPPGSLFKPILSLVALQTGIITPTNYITCTGGYTHYKTTWKCHSGGGVRNLVSALTYSCNTYYYIAYRNLLEINGFRNPQVGLDTLNYFLESFGLGKRLGIDIAGESPGFLPTSDFYKNLYKHEGGRWYSTFTISNGIGQGELELTTLQMANLAAILANRGFYFQPHLFKTFDDEHYFGDRLIPERHEVPIDKEHFDPVIEGMSRSISRGTGIGAYIPGIEVCGKTGTSQNPHGKDHSVFFAFAPRENPQIAIAVYVENAGYGGTYAAPIASLIIEKYLQGEISNQRQWLENRMKVAEVK
jgi:penicillin-binding protein 2